MVELNNINNINSTIVVSFVHGYKDLNTKVTTEKLPALWVHQSSNQSFVYNYPFPRNVSDFYDYKSIISGDLPFQNAKDFEKLPRFGFTGLAQYNDNLYAGSWNGVYEISKNDFSLKRIISNNLMNDMHGICVDEKFIITILTGKDTIVFSDFNGRIINHFTIANDLSVFRNIDLEKIDWRFISKQFRGATGIWHFNYVQIYGDEIWLTSRNLGAIIVVNIKTLKAHIRTMNQKTTTQLHDGLFYNNEYYFTSIDGKIIIASEEKNSKFDPREKFDGTEKFSRDLLCELIRLENTEFGKEPNWCRGIACNKDEIYVTIDGRYDEDLSFGLLGIKRSGKKILETRLKWKEIGDIDKLRYVTGFDLLLV